MNSVPADSRGAASGMMTTIMNAGMTASLGLFFTIVLLSLTVNLPVSFNTALASLGASNLDKVFDSTPPTVAMFSAFLGYNPVGTIIASVPGLTVPQNILSQMEGLTWFPSTLAPAFMSSLRVAFYVGMILSISAAIVSVIRGKRYVDSEAEYVADMDSSPGIAALKTSGSAMQDQLGEKSTQQVEYDTSGGVK